MNKYHAYFTQRLKHRVCLNTFVGRHAFSSRPAAWTVRLVVDMVDLMQEHEKLKELLRPLNVTNFEQIGLWMVFSVTLWWFHVANWKPWPIEIDSDDLWWIAYDSNGGFPVCYVKWPEDTSGWWFDIRSIFRPTNKMLIPPIDEHTVWLGLKPPTRHILDVLSLKVVNEKILVDIKWH